MFETRKNNDYKSDIVLGEKYEDKQTGTVGIATAIYFFQFACERVTLENMNKDGELRDYTFDAPRLTHVETQKTAQVTKTGGPGRGEGARKTPPRR